MRARSLWIAAALLFTGFAAGAARVLYLVPPVPKMDFDILGFAWLLMNLPRLVAFVALLCCTMAALYLWFRALISR